MKKDDVTQRRQRPTKKSKPDKQLVNHNSTEHVGSDDDDGDVMIRLM